MDRTRGYRGLLGLLLALGMSGAAVAQQEQQDQQQMQEQQQQEEDAFLFGEQGQEDAFLFGGAEGEEVAEAGEEAWSTDEYGAYYENYDWDATDEEFNEWYGEAEDDWFDWW